MSLHIVFNMVLKKGSVRVLVGAINILMVVEVKLFCRTVVVHRSGSIRLEHVHFPM